ncbi:Sec1-like protein [Pelagophyceae sp. CCMP2097]|nr:Sec1-like protein [Pelagophyceae sp. CCMP2097]
MPVDCIAATRFYIDKIVGDANNPGMKVLLLDDATTKTVAMVYSQTQILEKDVFLVERLEQTAKHEAMKHLKAAVFVRPTAENLVLLKAELADPKFAEYHIFFSNVVPADYLGALADADESELVRQVQEYFGDYVPVNEELFTINQRFSLRLSHDEPAANPKLADMFQRNVSAVLAALLSLKTQPSAIRFQATSRIAKEVALAVEAAIKEDGIFHFSRGAAEEKPVVLILDRADDAVTPLLSQWTYQAMVHELLGLNNNRVRIKVDAVVPQAGGKGPKGPKGADEEIVLSCTQDAFFAKHRHANFGDLGTAVKTLLDDYQKTTKMNEKISTIEDMQSFMQRYPAFRSQSLNVTKHVALMSELSRMVDSCGLMDISQLEQDLACNDDHAAQWRQLQEKLKSPQVKTPDKVRLALLYALRYEASPNVDRIRAMLDEARVAPEKIALVEAVQKYGGKASRGPGLFGSGRSLMSKMSKSLKTSLEGVENVYAQHVPLLLTTVGDLRQGKLKASEYPATTPLPPPQAGKKEGPRLCIAFIVGGVTYEEATKVAEFNAAHPNFQVLLGGSYIHNSTSFLDDLADAFGPRSQATF